jgi:TPP-dependent pyruvate/acetoin dehydrogenase alpha subunit
LVRPGVPAVGGEVLGGCGVGGEAAARARAAEAPTLLEVKTYRFMGHFEGDPERYRDDDERKTLRERDAIPALHEHIVAGGHATDAELEAIRTGIEAAVARAVEFARASPFPDPADLEKYVYPERLAREQVV